MPLTMGLAPVRSSSQPTRSAGASLARSVGVPPFAPLPPFVPGFCGFLSGGGMRRSGIFIAFAYGAGAVSGRGG